MQVVRNCDSPAEWAIPMIAASIVALPVAFALKLSKTPNAPELAGRVTSTIVVMLNVLIVPFIATLTALLYLKARQIGGKRSRSARPV